MGKNKNGLTQMSDLLEEKKKLEKKMSKITIPCSHTNKSGKVKFKFLGKGNLVTCKECGCTFDFGTIAIDDLDKAIRVIHNAINQIKSMSDDPVKEQNLIKTLGEMDYNLKELRELYSKAVSNYKGEGKKKNKKKNDSFGQYGYNSIDFIGSKKERNYY